MERTTEEAALLVAQTGPLNGQRWSLRKSLVIGRETICDIVIADRQVSRRHARLQLAADGIYLEDLDSKNGTHLNGQPVQGLVLLRDGDLIQIALTQRFVYLSSDATLPLDGIGPELEDNPADHSEVPIVIGRLRLEIRSRRVWVINNHGIDEEIIPPLSVSQFRLLQMLYENQGRVVSRPELAEAIWGEDEAFEVSEQALDALVRRLRERIALIDPDNPYIVTVRGHGLRLDNPPAVG